MNHSLYLIIYGIYNYSDLHKNKEWQRFSAMMSTMRGSFAMRERAHGFWNTQSSRIGTQDRVDIYGYTGSRDVARLSLVQLCWIMVACHLDMFMWKADLVCLLCSFLLPWPL
jgi:hypothetical protein